MHYLPRCLGLALAALLAGCATTSLKQATTATGTADDVEVCRQSLTETAPDRAGLNPEDIRLFNWNIQKSRNPASLDDLEALAEDSHLVLIQEAVLDSGLHRRAATAPHRAFAPGHQTTRLVTGVMTLSSARPLGQCQFTSVEPWLRSPKATHVTWFGLAGTDEKLAVVNIHAVNFTFGVRRFREQFERVASVLRDHDGPIVLSGDFNTWRRQRLQVVADVAGDLGLKPVRFEVDRRTRRFGLPLDHVYARGLRRLATLSPEVATSDHNPMVVHFVHAGGANGALYR